VAGRVRGVAWALMLATATAPGCVERTLKIRTNPAGALVTLNDEEVGVSPVKVSFLWYGKYDIILRKPGYQTLKTTYEAKPPWYEIPPFDLIAETLVATTIRDEHEPPEFTLERLEPPTVQGLIEHAADMQQRALYEGE
jgi:hypothetical protein